MKLEVDTGLGGEAQHQNGQDPENGVGLHSTHRLPNTPRPRGQQGGGEGPGAERVGQEAVGVQGRPCLWCGPVCELRSLLPRRASPLSWGDFWKYWA